jgi:hypothetical protein
VPPQQTRSPLREGSAPQAISGAGRHCLQIHARSPPWQPDTTGTSRSRSGTSPHPATRTAPSTAAVRPCASHFYSRTARSPALPTRPGSTGREATPSQPGHGRQPEKAWLNRRVPAARTGRQTPSARAPQKSHKSTSRTVPTGSPRTKRHSATHPGTPAKIVPNLPTDQRKRRSARETTVLVDGGQGQDRTVDLPLFRSTTPSAMRTCKNGRR